MKTINRILGTAAPAAALLMSPTSALASHEYDFSASAYTTADWDAYGGSTYNGSTASQGTNISQTDSGSGTYYDVDVDNGYTGWGWNGILPGYGYNFYVPDHGWC